MMKRIVTEMFSLLLAGILFTGCGAAHTAGGTSGTSGGAVSENVTVRSNLTQEDTGGGRQSGHRWGNDDNHYTAAKYGDELIQHDLEWNEIETIEMEISQVLWVTNKWIYYETLEEEEGYDECLWRVPIEKTKKGDRVKKKKREKLLQKYQIEIAYATDSYLILKLEDEKERESLYRYELNSRNQTELIVPQKSGSITILSEETGDPVILGGEMIIEENKKLICLNPDSGERTEIYSYHKKDGLDDFVCSDRNLYFLEDNNFYQYDSICKKVSCLITEKKFKEAVRKKGKNKAVSTWDRVYLEQGRLYFVGWRTWKEETRKKGKGKEEVYDRSEVYSAPLDEPGEICREDILMDYLDKKSGESYHEHKCGVIDIRNGNVEACYLAKKGGAYLNIIYNLKTKKIQEVS